MKNGILGLIPWKVVGIMIGGIVVVPIMDYCITKFYLGNKYNNDAEFYYQQYIDNSITIEETMPEHDSVLYLDNINEDFRGIETFVTVFSNSANYFSNPTANYIVFYSRKYKKWLNLIFFNCLTPSRYSDKDVLLTINKEDMQNPEYGTEENPVPVLKAVGATESIRKDDKDFDTTFMNEFYKHNVKCYLKYKMSKKEFKKRFKGKK